MSTLAAKEKTHADSLKQMAAEAIVKNYMMWTGAAGIIPVPIVDMAAISAIQLSMLNKIGDIYDQKFTANWGKSVIGSLVGGYASTSLGMGIGMNIVRAIPFIGSFASIVVVPGFAASTTWALGQVFILHFESGGTILDFNLAAIKEYFSTLVKSAPLSKESVAAVKEEYHAAKEKEEHAAKEEHHAAKEKEASHPTKGK